MSMNDIKRCLADYLNRTPSFQYKVSKYQNK